MKIEDVPLVKQCEKVLSSTTRLRDTVALNLKNFEAQGMLWAKNEIFPRRSSNGDGTTKRKSAAATVDVWC